MPNVIHRLWTRMLAICTSFSFSSLLSPFARSICLNGFQKSVLRGKTDMLLDDMIIMIGYHGVTMFPGRLLPVPVPSGQPRRGHSSYRYHPHSSPMTQAPSATTKDTSFQSFFNDATEAYNQKTNGNITSDPLFAELGPCTSANEILAVLYQRDQDLSASRRGTEGLTKWLTPTINVLYALSAIIGSGIGLVSINLFTSFKSVF
jgi:hypothetical protein